MKIIKQRGNCQPVVEEAPRPQPAHGEVLVRTAASALCGSEMHSYRKEGNGEGNLGHEAAGTVEALGEGVTTLTPGKRVGVSAIAGCGSCEECARGRYTWCANHKFICNMHAEYFVIPALACHVLPDDVPWDVGVLITGDGLGVPVHTANKISGKEIETVAIFGLGPIGLGSVLLQKSLGRKIIAIDRAPYRLELAAKLGATVVAANDGVDLPGRIRELTGGKGADVCIEAAGSPITAKLCFSSVRTAGTVIFNGEQGAVELSPSDDFIRRDITAIGSWYYHFNEFPEMLRLFHEGLPISSLITHHYSIQDADKAFRTMAEGKSGKIFFEYQPVSP
jgi:threonine dehydrogenase-like Zn-dependent dehydrogenase